ncbi:MAG: dTDP-glucose 4,6-dehydratase [Alphaproteobacteria bacterium]|nr:dTDP-glucose 4,6-dehydratase [Candidatus Parcubacteria bacterium]NCQ67545.1 dTDP-glucose 4,6-dehydratase [Alphaproteobacteria bacterium]
MRALVTGGAGFIGSHLIKELVKQGEVMNYDALTYSGRLENLEEVDKLPNYRFVQGNILDGTLLANTFHSFKPTVVFHLAAESHVDRSIDSCKEFVKTNVQGTQTLLDNTLHYYKNLPITEKRDFRFVHVSTDEVFGALGEIGVFTEESPYQPNSPYAASKASSDLFVRAFYKTYGLPTIITNCSNNYGPNQYPEKLIPLMILNALEGKKLPIYGKGLQIRDWLYVEDHVEALINVAQKGGVGEQYCIGGGAEMSNLDIVKLICDILDEKIPTLVPHASFIEFVEDRPGHDFRYAIDAKKMEHEIGWKAASIFKDALERTVDWYINNESWVKSISNDNKDSKKRRGIL